MCAEAPPESENSTPALEKVRSDGPRGNRIGGLLPSLVLSLLPHETGVNEEFSWESGHLHRVTLDLESSHSDGFRCIRVGGWVRSFSIDRQIQLIKFSSLLLLVTLIAWDKVLANI